MNIQIEERLSDSPFVERLWHGQTERAGEFTSIATNHWSLVVWQEHGQAKISIRGPETKATSAPVPENSESFGVVFKLGAFMPHLPVNELVDKQIDLPETAGRSFWLNGSAWQFPTYETIDIFINQLVRDDVLACEPIIEPILKGSYQQNISIRTAQRRFLHATGITQTSVHQIERARYATMLLKSGVSILDTIEQAGYYDQPHLTRLLKRYIGQTPAQLTDNANANQLSFLYNTISLT